MTPKDKAFELVTKYSRILPMNQTTLLDHKNCALVAVDEILESGPRYPNNVDWDDVGGAHQYYYEAQREEADKYWTKVKKEINKL
jgi:hypothetical protein